MNRKVVSVFGGAVVLCVAVAFGWFLRDAVGFSSGERKPRNAEVPTVKVHKVATAEFNPVDEFVGHVEPVQEVDILPQVEGYLAKTHFEEGSLVKAGDLLFQIDSERYVAVRNLRKAEIAQAESKVASAEAALDRSVRYLKRMKSTDERGITQTELDSAETDHASCVAELASAKAAVRQAEANLALAEYDVRHSEIRAPITGRIGKAFLHPGDYVAPSKGVLARIVQLDPVRVSFPMTDRAWLRRREEAVRLGADPAQVRRIRLVLPHGAVYPDCGSWAFEDNEMSAETATLQLRASFPNAKGLLVPNTYVRILEDNARPETVTVVPNSALVKDKEGRPAVWVVAADMTASLRTIEVGRSDGGVTKVLSGLRPGESVVSEGTHKVVAGEALRTKGAL